MKRITMHPMTYSTAMNGTKKVHTRAMAFTPPRMTAAASKQTKTPTIHVGMPNVS